MVSSNSRCEYCNKEHDHSYGSGRFCSKRCARGFSSKASRQEINSKISQALKGRHNLRKDPWKNGRLRRLQILDNKIKTAQWNDLGESQKRKRVLNDQENKCNMCHLSLWQECLLTLEYHHKDGNKNNNKRENVEFLCPNCHSLTKYWRKPNNEWARSSRDSE